MSTTYDSKALRKLSNNLYWSANVTMITFPVVGLVAGGVVGYSLFQYTIVKTVSAMGGAALGGYIGYRFGNAKATEMRSQAQTSLHMAKIEENAEKVSSKSKIFGFS